MEPGLHQVKQGGWYSRYRYEYVVLSFYKYTLSAHHVPAGFISECHRVLLLSWLTSSNKILPQYQVEINAITQVKGAERGRRNQSVDRDIRAET